MDDSSSSSSSDESCSSGQQSPIEDAVPTAFEPPDVPNLPPHPPPPPPAQLHRFPLQGPPTAPGLCTPSTPLPSHPIAVATPAPPQLPQLPPFPSLGSSPGAALLAASIVRSRTSYFERLSSNSSASTSSSSGGAGCCAHHHHHHHHHSGVVVHSTAVGGGATSHFTPEAAAAALMAAAVAARGTIPLPPCPPTPRHSSSSSSLMAHPLDPLASHPLSRYGNVSGGGGVWTAEDAAAAAAGGGGNDVDDGAAGGGGGTAAAGQDGDGSDADCEDTFFHKPSYTRYGSNVELSSAASYRVGGAEGPPSAGGDGGTGGGDGGWRHFADQPLSPVVGVGAYGTAAALAPAGPIPDANSPRSAGAGGLAASGEGAGGGGYVRSMSNRFGGSGRGSAGGSGGRYGSGCLDGLFDDLVAHVGALLASHPGIEAQMGMVQELSDRLLELQDLCKALVRKEDEVENLRGVLKELTVTRAEAFRLKVQMAESLNGLQQEYYKVLRSAQLAQGTCKQHSVRAAATRKQLADVQAELGRYKRAVAALKDRNRRLRSENEDMAGRLERLESARAGTDAHRSASYMALLNAQSSVLY